MAHDLYRTYYPRFAVSAFTKKEGWLRSKTVQCCRLLVTTNLSGEYYSVDPVDPPLHVDRDEWKVVTVNNLADVVQLMPAGSKMRNSIESNVLHPDIDSSVFHSYVGHQWVKTDPFQMARWVLLMHEAINKKPELKNKTVRRLL